MRQEYLFVLGTDKVYGVLQKAGFAQDGGQALEQDRDAGALQAVKHHVEMKARGPAGAALGQLRSSAAICSMAAASQSFTAPWMVWTVGQRQTSFMASR